MKLKCPLLLVPPYCHGLLAFRANKLRKYIQRKWSWSFPCSLCRITVTHCWLWEPKKCKNTANVHEAEVSPVPCVSVQLHIAGFGSRKLAKIHPMQMKLKCPLLFVPTCQPTTPYTKSPSHLIPWTVIFPSSYAANLNSQDILFREQLYSHLILPIRSLKMPISQAQFGLGLPDLEAENLQKYIQCKWSWSVPCSLCPHANQQPLTQSHLLTWYLEQWYSHLVMLPIWTPKTFFSENNYIPISFCPFAASRCPFPRPNLA